MKAVVQRRIELARSEPRRGDWKIPGEVIDTWMVLLGAELPIASSVSGRKGVCACVRVEETAVGRFPCTVLEGQS